MDILIVLTKLCMINCPIKRSYRKEKFEYCRECLDPRVPLQPCTLSFLWHLAETAESNPAAGGSVNVSPPPVSTS